MLLTDDASFADRVRYLSTQARQPFPHYEHTEMGFNYRMSNVLAAIGRAQLVRLDEMVSRRRSMRERYARHFTSVPGVSIFQRLGDDADNCWLTALVVDPLAAGWDAGDLGKAFGSATSRPGHCGNPCTSSRCSRAHARSSPGLGPTLRARPHAAERIGAQADRDRRGSTP